MNFLTPLMPVPLAQQLPIEFRSVKYGKDDVHCKDEECGIHMTR
jgi:hypothetical protein